MKLQKYEMVKIRRSEINLADYNPRKINKTAQEKLKKSIKKYGLVQPIVVNRRTGNVVGGNQRLTILDDINRNEDYELTVAMIDADEETEKKLNIVLNNEALMGEYDGDLLKEIINTIQTDPIDDLLFEKVDIDFLLGIDYLNPEQKEVVDDIEKIENMRNQRKEYKKKLKEKMEEEGGNKVLDSGYNDYTLTIVFNNAKSKNAFLKKFNIKSKYIAENILYDAFLPEKLWR